ncbi:MAG TPA: xanthine dehydrogenase family protein subunit M [Pyrinomonadaceae bacterium]|jgi:carbon-monoxide dehydrogenase medium subunit
MIPAQFDYVVPASLAEAAALLAERPDEAKILAGGHSLIPAMKLRLAQPQLLIDISRLKDLAYIREEGGQLRIGAMTTHYALESSARLREICPLLPACAATIGDVQVRNCGTIGGSLAHADPAADWPAAILALDAELVATSANGERTIRATDFFVDMLTTALEPGEILREIRVPLAQARAQQAYLKLPHPASGFAVVGVAVNLTQQNNTCASIAVGLTSVAAKAFRAGGVEQALVGRALDEQTIAAAAAHATDSVELNEDLFASADYRRHLAQVYTRRAITAAAG